MALTNVLLLSQIAGYIIGLILSLCIIVPMSMHQHEFSGHCLLFSRGSWQEDGQLLVMWASQAYCNYVLVVGVLMFIVCCIQVYRLSMFMYKGVDSSFLSAFIEAVGCVSLCGLAVSAAVMVTLGFMTWCQNIVERFPSQRLWSNTDWQTSHIIENIMENSLLYGFPSLNCEEATGQDIDKKDSISTHGFYIELGTAQFGAWGAFATWVGLAVFSTLKVCRYHQLENIQVSMYRERQRLVNENNGRSTPPIDSLGN